MKCPGCFRGEVKQRRGFRLGEFQLFECLHCTLAFVEPRPTSDELSAFYSAQDPNGLLRKVQAMRSEPAAHPDTAMVVDLVRWFAPTARSILEIGCGSGELLLGLQGQGYLVRGLELNEPLATLVGQKLQLSVQASRIETLKDVQFDAVIERHVLEHTDSPAGHIDAVHRAMAPQGLLIVAVPNFASLVSRWCGTGWEWFDPPLHLIYFSPTSMVNFLETRGFSPVHMFTRRGDALSPLYALAKAPLRRAFLRRVGPSFWKKPASPLYPGWARRVAAPAKTAAKGLYWMSLPLWWWAQRHGLGEELWCVAKADG